MTPKPKRAAKPLLSIQCQACEDARKGSGCGVCGGYGVVLLQTRCSGGHVYWTRPGSYTIFEGKEWTSRDGLSITCRNGKEVCSKCESKERTK